jgi:hypothetical protein
MRRDSELGMYIQASSYLVCEQKGCGNAGASHGIWCLVIGVGD